MNDTKVISNYTPFYLILLCKLFLFVFIYVVLWIKSQVSHLSVKTSTTDLYFLTSLSFLPMGMGLIIRLKQLLSDYTPKEKLLFLPW